MASVDGRYDERQRVNEIEGGVASNWHRLHAAARHHHKETRRRQKFFNFCYNFYHLQLPQPAPVPVPAAAAPVWIPIPAAVVGGIATGQVV